MSREVSLVVGDICSLRDSCFLLLLFYCLWCVSCCIPPALELQKDAGRFLVVFIFPP